jgi:hypothetical protein
MSAPIVTEFREAAADWGDSEMGNRLTRAADTIEALLETMKDFAEWEPESGVTLEHQAAWMKERAEAAIAKARA